ncbi:hypothetical protein QBZ16_002661 [Prototheca wickerhamii]|uniref:Uncharacterized protein n=1 Tax=Prototheca wickerhamii TaxID=3111 RepID=A0AAD9IJS7_PROWI|nr:hypothetical protein QBZ16_002661 [Prototheca wickerhamii]
MTSVVPSMWAPDAGASYSVFGDWNLPSFDESRRAQQDAWSRASSDASSPSASSHASDAPATPFSPARFDAPRPPSPSRRQCAKQVNMRLMHAHTPEAIFGIVVDSLEHCDSINLTAALQRLAKYLAARPRERAAVLGSPCFAALVGMMVAQCHAGAFNPQSTSNAWWAVSKLFAPDCPAPPELLDALEAALLGCLAAPREGTRPNAQAVSSTWYAWGRMGGYLPGPAARDALWDRTYALALTFDSQGVANMVWSWGQLRRRHGDAFAVRTDALAALTLLVQRTPAAFAVQGLSCTAMGCANLGVPLRAAAAPLMHVLVEESTRRADTFNMQAMANTASAAVRFGGAAPWAAQQPQHAAPYHAWQEPSVGRYHVAEQTAAFALDTAALPPLSSLLGPSAWAPSSDSAPPVDWSRGQVFGQHPAVFATSVLQ